MRVGKVKKDPWGTRIQREVVEAQLKMQEEEGETDSNLSVSSSDESGSKSGNDQRRDSKGKKQEKKSG